MNRRITKAIAEEAASLMANKVYKKRIDRMIENINKEAELLVLKYIPQPVLAVTKEYKDYLCAQQSVCIRALSSSGAYYRSIGARIKVDIPYSCSTFTVDEDDYKRLKTLYESKERVVNNKKRFKDELYQTLLSLKTEANVAKTLPEALAFITLPSPTFLPAKNYDYLRKIIGGINDETKEEMV